MEQRSLFQGHISVAHRRTSMQPTPGVPGATPSVSRACSSRLQCLTCSWEIGDGILHPGARGLGPSGSRVCDTQRTFCPCIRTGVPRRPNINPRIHAGDPMKAHSAALVASIAALALALPAEAERRDYPVSGITAVASSIPIDLE